MLHLEGQNYSALAARVLAATHFHQAVQHSTSASSDEDLWNIQASLHWERHREIDNDLAMLLHSLPDDVKLPNSIRCQNATFVNIIIHTSVICLHRAAILTMHKIGVSEETFSKSRARLTTAAEEILNILKMMPDVNDMLKNPMLAFSMYMASLVFLDQPKAAGIDYQRQDNLDLTLRFMILAAKTWGNPVTKSMAIQLALDMRKHGLNSPVVQKVSQWHFVVQFPPANFVKATELPTGRNTVPILAKGGKHSANPQFQIQPANSDTSPDSTTHP